MSGVVKVRKQSENELVLGIKSEGLGGLEEFSHICSSLPRIDIEGKEGVQFDDVLRGEDCVLGDEVLTEHSLEFLCLDFSLRHVDISKYNKLY